MLRFHPTPFHFPLTSRLRKECPFCRETANESNQFKETKSWISIICKSEISIFALRVVFNYLKTLINEINENISMNARLK